MNPYHDPQPNIHLVYPQQPPPQPQSDGLATAGLVLGIIGICFWFLIVPSLLALIFGHVGLSRINASEGWVTGRGRAITGITLGWIVTGLWLVFFLFAIISAITA